MSDATTRTTPHFLSAFILRCGVLAGVWWALTDGDGGWYLGAPCVLVIALTSLWLAPPVRPRPRLSRLPAFLAYFLVQSLRAGWDVARRTLSPSLPLAPSVLEFEIDLPPGTPRWWLVITVNLLPGTLVVRIDGSHLELHCLDATQPIERDLRKTEAHIAALFATREGV